MKKTTAFLIMTLFSFWLSSQEAKSPLPSVDDIKAAMSAMKDIFKDEYKNLKTPESRTRLAKKLLEQAADSANTPAMAYALIIESAKIAGESGDIAVVSEASNLFAAKFEGNLLPMRIKMFESAEKASSKPSPESLSALAEEYLKLADEAMADDDFSTVSALCINADRIAKKAKNTALVSKAADKKKEASDTLNALKAVSAAIEKLKANPDDPDANFAVGKYVCFNKDDWDKGLSMLAKSSDKDYKEAAELETAASDTASTMKSADKWWDLSDKEKSKPAKSAVMSHAAMEYQKILSELGGIDKVKVEKRIADSEKITENLSSKEILSDKNNASSNKKIIKPTEKVMQELKKKLEKVNDGKSFPFEYDINTASLYFNVPKGAATELMDISPLQGIGLKSLNIASSKVTNIEPLTGMPLTKLVLAGTKICDLSPLKGMKLEILSLGWNVSVSDISPLKEMPLSELDLHGTPINDEQLKNLSGMPLKKLNLRGCGVKDLTPLKGLPLTYLQLEGTTVESLEPLRGMPLQELHMGRCVNIKDFSPLKDCKKLKILILPENLDKKSVEFLKEMKLDMINGKPAKDFFK